MEKVSFLGQTNIRKGECFVCGETKLLPFIDWATGMKLGGCCLNDLKSANKCLDAACQSGLFLPPNQDPPTT